MEQIYLDAFLAIAKKNTATLNHIFMDATQEDVTTWRDGGTGWTALEVLGHLTDYNTIFHNRAKSIILEENPTFVGYNHEQLAIDNAYNQQSLDVMLDRFNDSRRSFLDFLETVQPEQWERSGIHPEYGEWKLTRSLSQLASHDSNHLEQITRILLEKKTSAS